MPSGNLTKKCRYVLESFTASSQAVYCNKPVNWTRVKYEDGTISRHYATWCTEHSSSIIDDDDEV